MNPFKDTELIFYGGEFYNGDKVGQSSIVLTLNINVYACGGASLSLRLWFRSIRVNSTRFRAQTF